METDSNCALYFVLGGMEDRGASLCGCYHQPTQRASDQRHVLAGKDRQHFVLELARYGKTPEEIEQIVTSIFDDPDFTAASSALAVPVAKK
ncbi:unnamed protein product [Peronospora destructor]|uniref:Uncharacterized protein n=1 Tax=Peronospora destructor TaxID=86335 RepID=A0AAV0UAP7_9STRA|nr:unnamed protein product [Peronospora destructor]